jgi:general secretion pathway protein C
MVALKNVAQSPFIADAEATVGRWVAAARRVPLKYWRMAVLALASVWICHNLAALVWYLVPSPELPVGQVTPKIGRTATATSGTGVDIAAVQALDLFGNASVQPVEAPPLQQQQLERTQLNLELQGIIAANDPAKSWAIINPKGNVDNQKLYKVGDPVDGANGAKVAEIQSLKVILNNNGTLEELWLYGEDGMNVATNSTYTPPPPRNDAPPPEAATAISREQIEQAKNIGDVVRFMVATENGKMIGYKVRPGRKRELFDMVGLKTDDIVVSVNGIEVNEPQKVREVYQALKNATEANLQVLRDGSTHSIQITMSSEG